MTLDAVGSRDRRPLRRLSSGCLVALIVALLLVGATTYALIDTRRQSQEKALQQAKASVERGQRLLAEAAGDGKLTDEEIARALRDSQASQENTARGRDTVTIVAQVRGTQAGLFGGTEVLRCYAYTVTFEPQRPHVQAREIDSCA
jgi:hypothetical protein